jgi:hypothetical protein
MDSIRRAVVVACLIFVGAVVGDLLQWLVPAHHLSDARGVIATVQALVTSLLAIVLGLLIWTSHGVYAQQQAEAMTLMGQVLQLDVLLDRLGTDGPRGRACLRDELIAMRRRFWGHDESGPPLTYVDARAELSAMDAYFGGFKAAEGIDETSLALARSLSTSVVMTILLMGRQLRNPIPHGLINSVILWAVLVFCCLGTTATLNALAIAVEIVGAVSVASAIFLILEFSQPYTGYFRIPSSGIDRAIAALSAPSKT